MFAVLSCPVVIVHCTIGHTERRVILSSWLSVTDALSGPTNVKDKSHCHLMSTLVAEPVVRISTSIGLRKAKWRESRDRNR